MFLTGKHIGFYVAGNYGVGPDSQWPQLNGESVGETFRQIRFGPRQTGRGGNR